MRTFCEKKKDVRGGPNRPRASKKKERSFLLETSWGREFFLDGANLFLRFATKEGPHPQNPSPHPQGTQACNKKERKRAIPAKQTHAKKRIYPEFARKGIPY